MGCCPSIPNIVIVYELVDNSLFHMLHVDRNRNIPLPQRVKIGLDCARVYHYMHNLGIVHRDIKSHNVLIDNNYHVKVCDFGLSKFIVSNVNIVSNILFSIRLIWEQERCSMLAHHATWPQNCFKRDSTMRRLTYSPSVHFSGRSLSARSLTMDSKLVRFALRSKTERSSEPTIV